MYCFRISWKGHRRSNVVGITPRPVILKHPHGPYPQLFFSRCFIEAPLENLPCENNGTPKEKDGIPNSSLEFRV